jgi:hypothetical protein
MNIMKNVLQIPDMASNGGTFLGGATPFVYIIDYE